MTTLQPETKQRCPDCEITYPARPCDPCPLCPLRLQHTEAMRDLHQAERWKVISSTSTLEIQRMLNDLEATGWSLSDFRAAHTDSMQDGPSPGFAEYVAVMERDAYNPERHVAAKRRLEEVRDRFVAKRNEINRAAAEFGEA